MSQATEKRARESSVDEEEFVPVGKRVAKSYPRVTSFGDKQQFQYLDEICREAVDKFVIMPEVFSDVFQEVCMLLPEAKIDKAMAKWHKFYRDERAFGMDYDAEELETIATECSGSHISNAELSSYFDRFMFTISDVGEARKGPRDNKSHISHIIQWQIAYLFNEHLIESTDNKYCDITKLTACVHAAIKDNMGGLTIAVDNKVMHKALAKALYIRAREWVETYRYPNTEELRQYNGDSPQEKN